MSTSKILYLLQGGFDKKNPDHNFYLITYDFKRNHGYIGKKGRNSWKLYTPLYSNPQIPKPESYHNYFKTFLECIEHLKKLTNDQVEIRQIEPVSETENSYLEKIDTSNQEKYNSDKSVLELASSEQMTLTLGAEYKLELYIDFLKKKESEQLSNEFINGSTFNLITKRHKARIKRLEDELLNEKNIIRPEDVPDFDL